MVLSMAVMAREKWTDERLDDLTQRVDRGFEEGKVEIRDLRSEMKTEFEKSRAETKMESSELRAETKTEFRELRAETKTEFRELRAEMNSRFNGIDARFDSLQKTMVLGVVGMSASIIGALIAVSF